MPDYPASDESCARLRQAGWSIGEIRGCSGRWFASGTNGENVIRAEGQSQAEAWYRATWQAEAAGGCGVEVRRWRRTYALAGSRHFGPSFLGLFTHRLTGRASMSSPVYGTSRQRSASAEAPGSSHCSSADGASITGICSWIGCITSFAVVVRIVQTFVQVIRVQPGVSRFRRWAGICCQWRLWPLATVVLYRDQRPKQEAHTIPDAHYRSPSKTS
jgi:hypothetical protein